MSDNPPWSSSIWMGRQVLVTGHTGFKGGWLAHWLAMCGAKVHGLALAPITKPNLFDVSNVENVLESHTICDIRCKDNVQDLVQNFKPEIVFHLAAQPLVRTSYQKPLETFATNIMGTAHILEAARNTDSVRAVVNITSDKCYRNNDQRHSFVETDPLGGSDPYSASKASAEIVATAYSESFLNDAGITLANARAGNTIGGGDWSADRLMPDIIRALDTGKTIEIRNETATRPWQHVLDALSGYLMLGEQSLINGSLFSGGWNFGPTQNCAVSVRDLLDIVYKLTGKDFWKPNSKAGPKEAQHLALSSQKAIGKLGWKNHWSISQMLAATVDWHSRHREGKDMSAITQQQIRDYMAGHVL